MPSNQKIPLPGYPSPVGYSRKLVWAGDYFGSNNYQAGGYNLTAQDFGLSGMESFGISFGGANIAGAAANTYMMRVKAPGNLGSNTETAASTFPLVTVQWYFSSNNAEVTNNTDLSGQGVRLEVRGV